MEIKHRVTASKYTKSIPRVSYHSVLVDVYNTRLCTAIYL